MEQVEQSWERYYKPLKLFKENIEEILRIVTIEFGSSDTQNDRHDNVSIEVGKYRLDCVDELVHLSEDAVDSLYIHVGFGRLRLHLGELAHLVVQDREDTKAMGVAHRIDGILQKRKKLFGFFATNPGYFLSMLSPILFAILLAALSSILSTTTSILLSVLFVIIWIASQCYYYYNRKHFVKFYMFHSHAKPSFFKRNKDAILINLITAIIAFLLGVFGTLLIQYITNTPKP